MMSEYEFPFMKSVRVLFIAKHDEALVAKSAIQKKPRYIIFALR